MRKLEKENELNIVESQTDEILNKLNEINKNINKEIEIKESEMIDFNEKREILQKKIINVLADIDTTKSENQKAQEKYNDIKKGVDVIEERPEDEEKEKDYKQKIKDIKNIKPSNKRVIQGKKGQISISDFLESKSKK